MTIAEQILRIKNNISSAYAKAEEKGATMPEVLNSDNLPTTIESITGGGGSDAIINKNPDGISPMYVWQGTAEEWENGGEKTWYNWQGTEYNTSEASTDIRTQTASEANNVLFFSQTAIGSGGSYNKSISYSKDNGKTWTDITYYDYNSFSNVVYLNGKYFIKNTYTKGNFFSSEDLDNWTEIPNTNVPQNDNGRRIVTANDKIFCFSSQYISGDNYYKLSYSDNGEDWTTNNITSGDLTNRNDSFYTRMLYVNGRYFTSFCGSNLIDYNIAYSEDLENWTQVYRTPGSSIYVWSLVNDGNRLLVFLSNKQVVQSLDNGDTWTSLGYASHSVNKVEYKNGKFYAITYDDKFVIADNPLNWTLVSSLSDVAYSLAVNNSGTVCFADSNKGYVYSKPSIFTAKELPLIGDKTYSEPGIKYVKEDFTKYGAVAVNSDYIASNFSTSNYISVPREYKDYGTYIFKFTTPDNFSHGQAIVHAQGWINLELSDTRQFHCWNFGSHSGIVLLSSVEANKTYWFKIVTTEDKTRTYYISTDGVSYSQVASFYDSGMNKDANYDFRLGLSSYDVSNPFEGSIDLKECSFEGSGKTWQPISEPTIASTGEGTITLSDNDTFNRNVSGDEVSQGSVGEVHPDYLSFIDGVGVRIGTTDIADM